MSAGLEWLLLPIANFAINYAIKDALYYAFQGLTEAGVYAGTAASRVLLSVVAVGAITLFVDFMAPMRMTESIRRTLAVILSSVVVTAWTGYSWGGAFNTDIFSFESQSLTMTAFTVVNLHHAISFFLSKSFGGNLAGSSARTDALLLDSAQQAKALETSARNLSRNPGLLFKSILMPPYMDFTWQVEVDGEPLQDMRATSSAHDTLLWRFVEGYQTTAQEVFPALDKDGARMLQLAWGYHMYSLKLFALEGRVMAHSKLDARALAALSFDSISLRENSARSRLFKETLAHELEVLHAARNGQSGRQKIDLFWMAFRVRARSFELGADVAPSLSLMASVGALQLELHYMMPMLFEDTIVSDGEHPHRIPPKGLIRNKTGWEHALRDIAPHLAPTEQQELAAASTTPSDEFRRAARIIEVHYAAFRGSLCPRMRWAPFVPAAQLDNAEIRREVAQRNLAQYFASFVSSQGSSLQQLLYTLGFKLIAWGPLALRFLLDAVNWVDSFWSAVQLKQLYDFLMTHVREVVKMMYGLSLKVAPANTVNMSSAKSKENLEETMFRVCVLLFAGYVLQQGLQDAFKIKLGRSKWPWVLAMCSRLTTLFGIFVSTFVTVLFNPAREVKVGLVASVAFMLGMRAFSSQDNADTTQLDIAARRERLNALLQVVKTKDTAYSQLLAHFKVEEAWQWTSLPTLAAPFVRLLFDGPALRDLMSKDENELLFGEEFLTHESVITVCGSLFRKIRPDDAVLSLRLHSVVFMIRYGVEVEATNEFVGLYGTEVSIIWAAAMDAGHMTATESPLSRWYALCTRDRHDAASDTALSGIILSAGLVQNIFAP
jgi:hypothetical protein